MKRITHCIAFKEYERIARMGGAYFDSKLLFDDAIVKLDDDDLAYFIHSIDLIWALRMNHMGFRPIIHKFIFWYVDRVHEEEKKDAETKALIESFKEEEWYKEFKGDRTLLEEAMSARLNLYDARKRNSPDIQLYESHFYAAAHKAKLINKSISTEAVKYYLNTYEGRTATGIAQLQDAVNKAMEDLKKKGII